jgi:outer membrane protein TolC
MRRVNGKQMQRATFVKQTLGVLAACMVAAQAAAQDPLTLEEAIALGMKHSARLAELEARQAGAAAAEAGAAAASLPIVAAQAGYTRTNHVEEFFIAVPGRPPQFVYPDVPNNYRSRLDLQWPIFTAGRADALERAARAEANAAGEDLASARADLKLEITRAYWAVVTARETEQVLARSLASLDAHVSDLRARLDQGLIPPNDVLSAEAQRSRERVLAIESANARAVAEADLRRLIGTRGQTLNFEFPIFSCQVPPCEPAGPGTKNPEIQNSRSDPQRAERRALEQRLAAAREREAAVRATGKPQVYIAGGFDYARPNPRIFPRVDRWDDSWDASVNVSWTLWDGGRRAAEAAQADAAARALEARLTDFDRQVTFEVDARRLELDSARAAITAAEDGIRSAVEARRVVGERYAAGVVTSTEVLDAEVAVLQAELDRTRAVANARLAEARLERALGR